MSEFTKREAREVLFLIDLIGVWERCAMSHPGMIEAACAGLICDLSKYLSPEIRENIGCAMLGVEPGQAHTKEAA